MGERDVKGLAIKDVAERTGLAAGTIRMWEQRYGFPDPARTASGYRMYSPDDVDLLRRVVSYRDRGLSVPAALERARSVRGSTDRPSIFGAIMAHAPVRAHVLRKRTLVGISRAIEDEALARAAGPVIVAAFQREGNYRAVEHRYRLLARTADACVAFADFAAPRVEPGEPVELPIAAGASLGNEWAVVVDAPGYAACLLAWEQPAAQALPDRRRRFEAIWTTDPETVRRAAQVGAGLAATEAPDVGGRLQELLADRPLAVESPTPGLTALTNRMLGYLEAG
jgi:DICT domain-containing protein